MYHLNFIALGNCEKSFFIINTLQFILLSHFIFCKMGEVAVSQTQSTSSTSFKFSVPQRNKGEEKKKEFKKIKYIKTDNAANILV